MNRFLGKRHTVSFPSCTRHTKRLVTPTGKAPARFDQTAFSEAPLFKQANEQRARGKAPRAEAAPTSPRTARAHHGGLQREQGRLRGTPSRPCLSDPESHAGRLPTPRPLSAAPRYRPPSCVPRPRPGPAGSRPPPSPCSPGP